MDKKSIGGELLKCRKAANLTQADVAKKLGVRQTAVSNWEGNVSRPSLEMLIQLASLYEVSLNTLCGVPEKRDAYRISKLIYDLSAACYRGTLQIENSKEKGICFRLLTDFFLYSEEKWEEDEPAPKYSVHGTTEYFETLQNLLSLRSKGLNADPVITSWVTDTIKKTEDEADQIGFKATHAIYCDLNGIDYEE